MDWEYSRHYARFHSDTPEHDRNLRLLFENWLRPHLPESRAARILDVGCGRGYALEWLRDLGYTRIAGIDTDAAQVTFAKGRGLDVQRVEDSAEFLRPHSVEYDLVLMMDVLEHLPREDDRRLLQAIRDALTPGGRLLCTTPNANSPLSNHWRYLDYTHETSFTVESIDYLLAHAGLRLVAARPLEFCLRPRLWFLPGRSTLRWWFLRLSRVQPRLACIGEFGWKEGRRVALSPNLLSLSVRD
ncbi:MAG: methyltransferase family protein [Verrucomicrobia bacterium]|nr:methyltransferase family protein [Verrucomicrobiota bacterium]